MIIEKNAFEVVQFVLKHDRQIAIGFNKDLLFLKQVVGLDFYSGGTVDIAFVFFCD